jgi:PAS domain S-box-containing protein
LVFVRDITEQKRITEELHETEGRLGDIINFLPDATFAIDREGTVIAWNRAIEEMTGVSANDILGKRSYEYSIPFYGDRRPILIDLVMSQDQGLLNNYTSIERDGDAYIAETDRAHVSGKELYLWGKSVLFKNAKGDVVGAIECIRDITDHKKAEKTLRESEERYRSLYVDSRDSIMIVSPEFGFLAANPATIELFACLDEQDFMNRTPATLSPKYQPDGLKSTDKSQEMMRLALENGSHFFEWTHCRADKTIFQATVLLSRLESGGKQILQGTVRDITERKLAEEALRETEGRLGDIINFLPDATFAIDREGKVIAWNRAIEEMTGISAKDILGKGDYEYAIPFYGERRPILIDLVMSQDPEVLNKYTSVRRDGDALTAETDRAHVGGKELYLWGKSVLFKNVKGDVVGAIESIRDITDHKKAEQELRQTLYQLTCNERNLRENEEKYRTVFENTGNATVVLDKSGCIDLANNEFTQLSGFSKDDIEGKMRLTDFVISEDQERMLAHHHLHWQEQKASLTHYEFRFVTRSGDIRNIYLSIDLIPGTNKSVASLLDITGRKQAEELYQTVFENTGTAMVIIEEDMTISHVNQEMEKIWGYLKEEIEGRVKWPTLVAEEDRKSMIDHHQLWLVSNDSSPVSYEFRFIHKNGTLRDAVLTASIIPGMKKSVISLRDITEFKKLDFHVKARTQQVEQLLRQKDEFISQVGHDLKTPLTPIIALLPHIYKKEQDPALRELLMVVIDGASAIKGLITDILTLAQLNMPYTTQDLKEMVLAEEVDKEIIKHTWEAEKRGALIKNCVSPDTRIWISPFHLESILTNLISNAVRYTPGAGCVKISSESDEESIVISVTDTGIGLAPEETPRIFEEFYKADSSRHDRNSSGLGLSIVSRIVHLYGGTVKAESLGIGYGSTFTVTIPQHN